MDKRRSWDPDDLHYAAGFLDGEGCFFIHRRENGKHHKGAISCSNTHRPTIEWFQQTFGGSISKGKSRKSNHRPVYSWQVVANDAFEICGAVLPYLKQKTEQALLLFALQQTRGYPLSSTLGKNASGFQSGLRR